MKAVFTKNFPNSGTLIIITNSEMATPLFSKIDNETKGTIRKALNNLRFEGKKYQTAVITTPAGTDFDRIVIASVGKKSEMTPLILEETAAKAVGAVLKSGVKDVYLTVDFSDGADCASQACFGAICGNYSFDKYKTTAKIEEKSSIDNLFILCENPEEARQKYEDLDSLLQGMTMVRNLVSEPGNVVNPESFAKEALELRNLGVEVEVIEQEELKNLGLNMMLSVGQGSDISSKLAVMRFNGNPKNDRVQLAVIGKGVTFDTGGISLKSPDGMEEMKMDMAGAAVATALMKTLALRKAKANVVAVAGLVENMPSGKASRPGDIVQSLSGQTVEIISTDAEGRMVLGDAMWYAQEKFRPEIMVDLATLTGAIIISLANERAGLFSNDDGLADKIFKSGEKTGEYVWRLPLGEAYDELINSDIADMKNVGGKAGGSITAAQFLKRFVKEETKWAHLDIAGTAWIKKDKPLYPKGATGFGVRLLDSFIKDNLE
ncbi:MAG: leucyl aminopeptidase [Alphaproteobacteria bacterium]